jgi:uncharacterized protein YqgV (UPF0045/DUF77 family)
MTDSLCATPTRLEGVEMDDIVYQVLTALKESILDSPFTAKRSLMVDEIDTILDALK